MATGTEIVTKECFLCSTETKSTNHYYSDAEEHSMTLCQILGLTPSITYDVNKYGKIIYCPRCRNKIWKINEMLDELEKLRQLEMEVSVSKDTIRHQLKERCKLYSKNPSWTNTENQRFRVEIVNQLKYVPENKPMTESVVPIVQTKRKRYAAESAKLTENMNVHVPVTKTRTKSVISVPQVFLKTGEVNCMEPEVNKHEDEDVSENQMLLEGIEPGSESNDEEADKNAGTSAVVTTTNFCEVQIHAPDSDTSEVANEEKSFICGTCGVMFDFYQELEEHMKFHEVFHIPKPETLEKYPDGVRRRKRTKKLPKKCEECGKVLSTSTTWRNHVLTVHRRESKFKCPHCDFGCQQPANLKDHIQTAHTDKDKFSCRICSTGFKLKRYLVTHIQKKHGISESDEIENNIVEELIPYSD